MEEQEQEEWEEEEQLVVAELSGVIDSEALRRWDGWCKVVGLDSEQPVLQLGRYVFAGEYEDAVGTCVIFQEEANAREDPASTPALRYMCHTAKKLMLQRTFLSETKEGEARSQGIELLSLNEGDVCGRSGMVCHYTLDPKELERVKAEAEDQGPGVSDESDTETAATEHSMLDVTESTENAEQGAESTIAESEQENY
ncbi:general transcription factor 3C polypeptide 6 [Astyanax mexicanus]|uniref:General transcription factor 3C polypeptide 6 n=2 Tax=Astyanax mexicanus TaxID=7994 RepID=A0A8B9KQT4_ASTMX|nr:general transcription factor 3C polypeptide 6 [Astyanax mexicanus]KAG9276570.1 general transcription factor 3C polypeptide 6 [Astyanax mexicanus]